MSSAPWVSKHQVQIKFAVIKRCCRRKVRIGCCADCLPLPVCQIVINKKLSSVLHPISTCLLLSVCLSAASHSVGLAQQRGEEQDWIDVWRLRETSLFKLPSDRTGTKEPITVLLKSVYWRHIHYRVSRRKKVKVKNREIRQASL